MAKIRKPFDVNPLGNTPGAKVAAQNVVTAQIDRLLEQASQQSVAAGLNIANILKEKYGLKNDVKDYLWKLKSGKSVRFYEVELSYENVKDDTYVTFDINGRDQEFLNSDSLRDLESLTDQQFYPAIARMKNDRFEILDGSRRRAKFLLAEGKIKYFRVLVTEDELSSSDAKDLAKKLQTSKEHSLREIGKRAQLLKSSNELLGQVELAAELGVSQAKVSRALLAASISDNLVHLFRTLDELTFEDYKKLAKIQNEAADKLQDIVKSVRNELAYKEKQDFGEQKKLVFEVLKGHIDNLTLILKDTKKDTITQLSEFSSSGVYARKRISGRKFSYEFSRLPDAIQKQLDDAVKSVLNKYKG
ncbi:hypothetical protein LCGC14_0962570 [marine sediment metagenome]|uniref:ParB protein family C-terminal domain-containing protein n=1 Tax=marine sediment metagenome TaxID=412755 RepID=A0A0F9NIT4_9ZZZZ|nr:ParB/RepB/Spo0J family partition protein [Methylophaga sp.]